MQGTKAERTMQLIRATVAAKTSFLRSLSNSQPDQRMEVEFKLPSGPRVRIAFDRYEDLASVAAGDFDLLSSGSRINFRLLLDGEVKIEAQFSPVGLDLVAYTPGSWERGVGLSNDNDREVILPPALRKRPESIGAGVRDG